MSLLAAALVVVVASAQGPGVTSNPVDLPNGPAKPGFDITRFSNAGNGAFETFYVTETQWLRDALAGGTVADDTRLLVTDTAGGKIALLTEQMAFHHIAQGSAGGQDWLLSF
ncbi:MAG: hypothetical protein HYU37_08080 [Acidobacteria bacterium]|nr:hypothetical protein [Acidobacteriota bacterium]